MVGISSMRKMGNVYLPRGSWGFLGVPRFLPSCRFHPSSRSPVLSTSHPFNHPFLFSVMFVVLVILTLHRTSVVLVALVVLASKFLCSILIISGACTVLHVSSRSSVSVCQCVGVVVCWCVIVLLYSCHGTHSRCWSKVLVHHF